MAEFTEKNYAKFFGENLLVDVMSLDTDLAEEIRLRAETNQIIESFDSQASLDLDEVLDLDEEEIKGIYEGKKTSDDDRYSDAVHADSTPTHYAAWKYHKKAVANADEAGETESSRLHNIAAGRHYYAYSSGKGKRKKGYSFNTNDARTATLNTLMHDSKHGLLHGKPSTRKIYENEDINELWGVYGKGNAAAAMMGHAKNAGYKLKSRNRQSAQFEHPKTGHTITVHRENQNGPASWHHSPIKTNTPGAGTGTTGSGAEELRNHIQTVQRGY